MWRRQREDDGRLQSVIQFLRMTGTENLLPVCRRRGSRRGYISELTGKPDERLADEPAIDMINRYSNRQGGNYTPCLFMVQKPVFG